jgi:hypothetical protein
MAPTLLEPTFLDRANPVLEPVFDAEPVEAHDASRRRARPVRAAIALASAAEWCFGFVTIFVALAMLSAVPVLQLLSLGYLLEASGRVARSGQMRDSLIGVRPAARVGGIVLGCWLWFWPARFAVDTADAAAILDPADVGLTATAWHYGTIALALAIGIHLSLAVLAGGQLWRFAWPFNLVTLVVRATRGGFYVRTRDAACDFVARMRLPHLALLGLKGFVVGLAWLALPATFLAVGRQPFDAAPLFAAIGMVQLALAVVYLPFLQARVGQTGTLRGGFELAGVRDEFRHAPWAFLVAFAATLLFALPLYLLKIEVIPREAAWLPGLVFVAILAPARLLTGYALGRARRRRERVGKPRHFVSRWSARLFFPPVAAFYVLWLTLMPYTSWNGVASYYEQHAFLLPVPLIAL